MACARRDFYAPKASTKGQLLEAKENLQRMLANIPLTDDEQAAVDDGHEALDRLIYRPADLPTPSGNTARDRRSRDRHLAPHRLGHPNEAEVTRCTPITYWDHTARLGVPRAGPRG
jgi:hypothetical protein